MNVTRLRAFLADKPAGESVSITASARKWWALLDRIPTGNVPRDANVGANFTGRYWPVEVTPGRTAHVPLATPADCPIHGRTLATRLGGCIECALVLDAIDGPNGGMDPAEVAGLYPAGWQDMEPPWTDAQ